MRNEKETIKQKVKDFFGKKQKWQEALLLD